jgi:methylenetetrahydrofolate reductase (NADPH)
MPFVSVPGTKRMAAVNGCHIPAELEARMDAVDGDAEAVRRLGAEVASSLCQELLDQGVRGLHLYSMNRSSSIREIYGHLGW